MVIRPGSVHLLHAGAQERKAYRLGISVAGSYNNECLSVDLTKTFHNARLGCKSFELIVAHGTGDDHEPGQRATRDKRRRLTLSDVTVWGMELSFTVRHGANGIGEPLPDGYMLGASFEIIVIAHANQ